MGDILQGFWNILTKTELFVKPVRIVWLNDISLILSKCQKEGSLTHEVFYSH